MEKCLREYKVGEQDAQYGRAKREELVQQYEESIKRTPQEVPYGIKDINLTCAYPVHTGEIKSAECKEDDEGQTYQSYTPKHVDTPEEIMAKYYSGILKDQKAICDGTHSIECLDPPIEDHHKEKPEKPTPIMVAKPDIPPGACNIKTVTFAEDVDRCNKDRYDLCNLKTDKVHCGCTDYQPC